MKSVYNDLDYAIGRLIGTVVKVGGEPYYVHSIHDYEDVTVQSLESMRTNGFRESIRLKDIDLNPFRLGYTDGVSKVYYPTRVPGRQWKQGLRANQLTNMPFGEVNMLKCHNFLRMLKNIYAPLESIYENLLNDERESQAISSHFALVNRSYKDGKLGLLCRGRLVGKLTPSLINPEPELTPRFKFLNEMFEKEVKNA